MKIQYMATPLLALLLSSNSYAEVTLEQMSAQLEKFQTQVKIVQDKMAAVESVNEGLVSDTEAMESEAAIKSDSSVKINGYMDAYYRIYSGAKNASKNDGFRIYRFSLIPNQQINSKLRWLAELELEDTPRQEDPSKETTLLSGEKITQSTKLQFGKIFLERVYIQYDINPMLKVRVGRDFAHSTIWSDNHYPTFVLPESRPLSERKIFAQLNDGVEILGNTLLGSIPFDYIAYIGNGNAYDSHDDINDEDAIGARLRVQLPLGSFSRVSLAVKQGGTITDTAVVGKNEQDSIGLSFEQKFDGFDFKGQYSKADISKDSGDYSLIGMYANASYTIGSFTPWVQYDTYEDESANTKDKRISLGLMYSVSSNLKLKVESQMDTRENTTTGANVASKKGTTNLIAAALYF